MPRARNVKPAIFLHEGLAGLAAWVRLLFIGMWTLADRAGRLGDRPRRIAAALFPYEASLDIELGLTELAQCGFIERYAVAGEDFIQIQNFRKHQHPHKQEPESTMSTDFDRKVTLWLVQNDEYRHLAQQIASPSTGTCSVLVQPSLDSGLKRCRPVIRQTWKQASGFRPLLPKTARAQISRGAMYFIKAGKSRGRSAGSACMRRRTARLGRRPIGTRDCSSARRWPCSASKVNAGRKYIRNLYVFHHE